MDYSDPPTPNRASIEALFENVALRLYLLLAFQIYLPYVNLSARNPLTPSGQR